MPDLITSTANEKIKRIASLIKKPKERKASGLFTAEGIKIFSEARKEDIEQVFVSESFFKENEALLSKADLVLVKDEVFEKLCDTKTPQGILTVFKQPVYTLEEIINKAENGPIVVLEEVQDPGNVGTIIRTAEGAGVAGLILSSGCADIYSPKTIRASMGSVLRVPTVTVSDMCIAAKQMKQEGVTLYAAHLNGKNSYDQEKYEEKTALLIGNEAKGLSDSLSAMADVRIRIPMEGKLESLNAAVAASIILYTIYTERHGR